MTIYILYIYKIYIFIFIYFKIYLFITMSPSLAPFRRITNRVWREKSRVTRMGGVSYVRGRDAKLEAKTSNQFVVFCKHLGRAHEKRTSPYLHQVNY